MNIHFWDNLRNKCLSEKNRNPKEKLFLAALSDSGFYDDNSTETRRTLYINIIVSLRLILNQLIYRPKYSFYVQ